MKRDKKMRLFFTAILMCFLATFFCQTSVNAKESACAEDAQMLDSKVPSITLSNFSVNKKTLKNGDYLIFKFKVSGTTDINGNVAIMFNTGTGFSVGGAKFDTKTHYMTVSNRINNIFEPGKYKIASVTLYDSIGNALEVKNSAISGKKGKGYADMSKANFTVAKHNLPEITCSDFSINKKTFKNGDTLKIKFKVSGNIKNISAVEVMYNDSFGVAGGTFSFDKKTGYVTYPLTVNDNYPVGKVKISTLTLRDEIGNRYEVKNSDFWGKTGKGYANMSKTDFTVTKGSVGSVKLSDFSVQKKQLKNGEVLKIKFKCEGKKIKTDSALIEFNGDFGIWKSATKYDEKTHYITFTMKISNKFSKGSYKISRVGFNDENGSRIYVYNSKFYNKTGKNYVDMSKANFKVIK